MQTTLVPTSHLLGPAPLMLAVEWDCFFSVQAQLGGSGAFLCREAPNMSSDTQSNGQVGPWEDTGRGSCRALTQLPSPSKGASQHPASSLPRGIRTGVPLPASCHRPATTCLCHWVTRLCQNFYFSLPPPINAVKNHIGSFCKLANVSGPDPKLLTVTQQIPVDSSGLGPGP